MIKRTLCFVLAIVSILMLSLTGCQTKSETVPVTTEPPVVDEITIKSSILPAWINEAYDLSSIVEQEEGVEYSFKASYLDPSSGESKELVVKRNKITPKVEADIQVEISADKNGVVSTQIVTVPIYIQADAMDRLMISGAASGEASTGVNKILTKDKMFCNGENSLSSLETVFTNPGSANEGACLVALSHHSLLPYYSAKVWKNAAVTAWVYNPMDQAVDFKLTSYNPATMVILSWDNTNNTQIQTAQPGQWTQISFSLYDMGITQPLYTAPDGLREDSLKLCARYAGSGECKIYIDGIDVVQAESLGMQTGYVDAELPAGDFSDILSTCKVYTNESVAELTESTNGNGTKTAYRFGADQRAGYPTFYIDFPEVTDISGFEYLKFDVYAEKCYPYVVAGVRYLDENGEEQRHGTSYDFYREQWRTIYLNLDYLKYADLTKVVGLYFSIHVQDHFVDGSYNCVYFDNMMLYDHPVEQPQIAPATIEDNDLLNNPFYAANIKPNTSGVCKVATDENGDARSNSTLLFWTNNACGYPNVNAQFVLEHEQDWSSKNMLSLDSHQYNGHFWMGFTLITLDEEGKEKTYFWRHDTVLTHWQTTAAPFEWFKDNDGNTCKPEDLKRVIGFHISVDLAVNVTDEVAHIFFDNIYVN